MLWFRKLKIAFSSVALSVVRIKGIQKRFLIILCQCSTYTKGLIEDMAKQRTGIVVTRSEPTSGCRKWSEAKWQHSRFYLPRSKPSYLKFRGLSNKRNAFTYIFKHGNVDKKPLSHDTAPSHWVRRTGSRTHWRLRLNQYHMQHK